MQKYKRKTPLACAADRVLAHVAVLLLGIGWFVYLWGLSLPALLAGFAFSVLIWLCVRRFGKQSVQKREKELRRTIGGEMALQRLLLLPTRHAAFQAAVWLSQKWPLEMQKTTEHGVLCKQNGESVLVRLIAQHESLPVTVQQIIEVRREALEHEVKRCLICLTAPLSRDAQAYAETGEPKLKVVSREDLIRLAGVSNPATDEQLSALGKQKRARVGWKRWMQHVLSPKRTKKYFVFGMGLAALYFLTGLWYYPIPAMLCLLLCIGSRAYKPKEAME